MNSSQNVPFKLILILFVKIENILIWKCLLWKKIRYTAMTSIIIKLNDKIFIIKISMIDL